MNGFDKDFNFENEEKILNYLFYFSDILNLQSTALFQTSLIDENKFFVEKLFNHKYNQEQIQPYNFYLTSILGASQQNLYIPYRTLHYPDHTYFKNLMNNNFLNFFNTDSILPLNIQTNVGGKKNSGVIMNFNKKIVFDNEFSWEKHLLKVFIFIN